MSVPKTDKARLAHLRRIGALPEVGEVTLPMDEYKVTEWRLALYPVYHYVMAGSSEAAIEAVQRGEGVWGGSDSSLVQDVDLRDARHRSYEAAKAEG